MKSFDEFLNEATNTTEKEIEKLEKKIATQTAKRGKIKDSISLAAERRKMKGQHVQGTSEMNGRAKLSEIDTLLYKLDNELKELKKKMTDDTGN